MINTWVDVGSVSLPSPLLNGSGTAGFSDELRDYLDYDVLGAFVNKSVRSEAWAGNAAPRVAELPTGMINSIGLPGPGVERWLNDELPKILKRTDRVIAAIWGFTVEEYALAGKVLRDAPPEVLAVEVNVSCPNTDAANKMFAASPELTAAAVEAASACNRPMWAKLSPAVSDIGAIAGAAYGAGAEAVVLANTMPGMRIDTQSRSYALGAGARGGGTSGAGVHPIAVKLVHDVRAKFPDKGIVGIGGVSSAADVIEFLMAGANAVGIGTALFYDPRIITRIAHDLERWCAKHNVTKVSELIGVIHEQHSS